MKLALINEVEADGIKDYIWEPAVEDTVWKKNKVICTTELQKESTAQLQKTSWSSAENKETV